MINFEDMVNFDIGLRIKRLMSKDEIKEREYCSRLEMYQYSTHEHFANTEYRRINRHRFKPDNNESSARKFDKKRVTAILAGAKTNQNSFFPKDWIMAFCKLLKVTPCELFFGDAEERKNLVKHILLAVIINGDTYLQSKEVINPIISVKKDVSKIDREYFIRFCRNAINDDTISNELATSLEYTSEHYERDADGNIDVPVSRPMGIPERDDAVNIKKVPAKVFEVQLDEYIALADEYLHKEYGFFATPEQYDIADKLKKCRKNDTEVDTLERPSNLLIKTLMGNLDFATNFLNAIMRYEGTLDEGERYLQDYAQNKGVYGGFAIEWKGIPGTHVNRYRIFVNTFNDMWTRNEDYFMDFFNKNIFDYCEVSKQIKLPKEKGKRQEPHSELTYVYKEIEARFSEFTNEKIQDILTGAEFMNLLYEIIEREQYDKETMHGHMYAHTVLHGLIANTIEQADFSEDYNIDRLNNDISALMTAYSKLQKKEEPSVRLSLGKYCEIKPFV